MRVSQTLGTRLFLFFGLGLFALGIVLISNRHRFFTRTFVIYADFDRLNGIEKGATVRLSGLQAGEVLSTEITPWPEGRLRLKLRLGENLHPFVRDDSVASIRTSGLAGSTFLDIQKGTQRANEVAEGATLPTVEPIELTDLMREGSTTLAQAGSSLQSMQQRADTTLLAVTSLTQHLDSTLAQARPGLLGTVSNAQQTTRNLSSLTQAVQQGKGLAGKLLTDDALAASVAQTASGANHAVGELDQASARLNAATVEFQQRQLLARAEEVLQNAQQVTANLNGMLETQNGAAPANLQATLAATQRAMVNLADDTAALKHNFFLRGFFKNRGYYDLQDMSPAAYRESRFLKGHTQQRSWLAADALFSKPAAGTPEQLTPAGQTALDTIISSNAANLPNSALMVEGYAAAGTRAQNLRSSQARADLVRNDLMRRYSIPANLIASRAMESHPPAGTDKTEWDGISIIVLVP